jgi:hypothetical protein
MIKDLPPPTEVEKSRNTAEILWHSAAQVRFGSTRNELVSLAENLDRLTADAGRPCAPGYYWEPDAYAPHGKFRPAHCARHW